MNENTPNRRPQKMLGLFFALLLGAVAGYHFITPKPTLQGGIEHLMVYPMTIPLVFLTPAAWVFFLPMPLIAILVSLIHLRGGSQIPFILPFLLVFAASLLHAFFIEALRGI